MLEPLYDVAVGDRVRVKRELLRTDGLMDRQEIEGVVTKVTATRFEYRADRVIRAENVLRPITEGGWSRLMDLETLRTYGVELMPKAKPKTDGVVGRKIVEARPMTRAELEAEGWGSPSRHGPPVVLVLDDGTRLYPSRDDEGNGPGALFGVTPDGKSIAFHS